MKEVEYQRFLENVLDYKHKKVKYGVTDITTDNEHIEIKKWSDYKNALGQILSYNTCDRKDKLSVYFFGYMDPTKKIGIIDLFKEHGINICEFEFLVKELYVNDSKDFLIRNLIINYFKIGNEQDYVSKMFLKKFLKKNNKTIVENDFTNLVSIVEYIFKNLHDNTKGVEYKFDNMIKGIRYRRSFFRLTLK